MEPHKINMDMYWESYKVKNSYLHVVVMIRLGYLI